MSLVVPLDAGPLGAITNPGLTAETREINQWLEGMLLSGVRVIVTEIADYEARRELFRADTVRGIARLDALAARPDYLPLATAMMCQAAEFWAIARRRGRPTAPNAALDADALLAAQARLAGQPGDTVVVATTNVGHLSLFVDARH